MGWQWLPGAQYQERAMSSLGRRVHDPWKREEVATHVKDIWLLRVRPWCLRAFSVHALQS